MAQTNPGAGGGQYKPRQYSNLPKTPWRVWGESQGFYREPGPSGPPSASPYVQQSPWQTWGELQGYARPQQPQPGQGFWEDPIRVVRYRNMARAMPENWQAPQWLNMNDLETAYELHKQTNAGAPEWAWKPLPTDNPGRQFLALMQPPPDDLLWPGEQQYSQNPQYATTMGAPLPQFREQDALWVARAPEDIPNPAHAGLTDNQYNQLKPWQQGAVALFAGPIPGIGMAGITGAAIGGALVPGIGAAVGGLAAGGAALYGYYNPEGTVASWLNGLDAPRNELFRYLGVLHQLGNAIEDPEKYGTLTEVLSNWEATKAAGELYDRVFFTGWMDPTNILAIAGGDQPAPAGYAWRFGEMNPETGLPYTEPVQVEEKGKYGEDALIEARQRIVRGEDANAVIADIMQRYGMSGQAGEFVTGFFLDPIDRIPGITSAGVQFYAGLTGNTRLGIAMDLSKGPMEGVQLYANFLQTQVNASDVSKMDGFSRWLAGVTPDGNPTWATAPAKNNPLAYLFSLTPKARADAIVNNAATNLALVLDVQTKDPKAWVDTVHKLVQTPHTLASELSMASIESVSGAAVPIALKDYLPVIDTLLASYEANAGNRIMLTNIANVLAITPAQVLARLSNPTQADILLRQLVTKVEGLDTDQAKAITAAYADKSLTGQTLTKLARTFIEDKQPLDADAFLADMYVSATNHMSTWAAQFFNVKPDPTWSRLADTVKAAQSALVLGFSPTYFLTNVVSNVVAMSASGVLGLRSTKQIGTFWNRFGIVPPRLRAGVGIAALGDTADFGPIQAAGRVEGPLTNIKELFSQKTKRLQIFSHLSGEFEKLSSQQAFTAGTEKIWRKLWRRGLGFDKMNPELVKRLSAIDPNLPAVIYGSIEAGMNKAEIEAALWSGMMKRTAQEAIPIVANQLKMSVDDVTEALDNAGMLSKEFADKLADAKTPEDIRNLLAQQEEQIQRYLNDLSVERIAGHIEHANNRTTREGLYAAMEIFDNLSEADAKDWYDHWAHMQEVAEVAATMEFGQARAYYRQQLALAKQRWQRVYQRRSAQYQGIAKAVGWSSQTGGALVQHLTDNNTNWNKFYAKRDELWNKHFNTQYKNSKEWWANYYAVLEELEIAYSEHVSEEVRVSEAFHKDLVRLATAQAGQIVGKAVETWGKGVRDIRDTMGRDMRAHRAALKDMRDPKERRAAWTEFLKTDYLVGIGEMLAKNYEGARNIWNEASKYPTDRQTPVPAPDLDAIKQAVEARRAEVEGPLEKRMREAQERARWMDDTWKIAQEYGIVEAGVDVRDVGGRSRLLNTINKYLENHKDINGGKRYSSLESIPPDEARQALEYRKGDKAIEAAKAAAAAAEPVIKIEPVRVDAGRVQEKMDSGMSKADAIEAVRREMEAEATAKPAPLPEITDLQRAQENLASDNPSNYNYGLGLARHLSADDRAKLSAEVQRTLDLADITDAAITELRWLDLPPDLVREANGIINSEQTRVSAAEPSYQGPEGGRKSTYPEWWNDVTDTYAGEKTKKAAVAKALTDIANGSKPLYQGKPYAMQEQLIKIVTEQIRMLPEYKKAIGYLFDQGPQIERALRLIERDFVELVEIIDPTKPQPGLENAFDNLIINVTNLIFDADRAGAGDDVINPILDLQDLIIKRRDFGPDDADVKKAQGHENGMTTAKQLDDQAPPEEPPTTLFQRRQPGQTNMFAESNADLPLFSGTPEAAAVSTFRPAEAARQSTFAGMTPAELSAATLGVTRREFRSLIAQLFLAGQDTVLAGTFDVDAQADAVLKITDARASVWAKQTGRPANDWYQAHTADITAADEMPGGAFASDATLLQKFTDSPLAKAAFQKYGETYNIREAGYIMPDGKLLDMSGRNEAQGYKKVDDKYVPEGQDYLRDNRNVDHRDVWDLLPEDVRARIGDDYNGPIQYFTQETGAVRIDQRAGTIDVRGPLSSEQIRIMVDYFDEPWIDVHNKDNGDYVMHMEPKGRRQVKQALTQISQYHTGERAAADLTTLFQSRQSDSAKAAVQFLDDGRAIIYALKQPDLSSVVHELGHIFRRDLTAEDNVIAAEWAGAVDNTWTVAAEEKFARGFEQYLRDGQAPTPGLVEVFAKFKTWLGNIYARLRGAPLEDISPKMRGVYERLLAGEPDTYQYNIYTDTGRVKKVPQQATLFQNPPDWLRTEIEKYKKILEETPDTYENRGIRGNAQEHIDNFTQELNDLDGDTYQHEDGRQFTVTNDEPKAVLAELGEVDKVNQAAPIDEMQAEGLESYRPIINGMADYWTDPANATVSRIGDIKTKLDPSTVTDLRKYMGKVYGQMGDTKLASVKWGENRRDAALLNYQQRTGLDSFITAMLPYQFWYTRSALQWAARVIDKPSWLSNYARIRRLQSENEVEGYPTRLKNKIRIPMPFLPDWMGDAIYIDPMKQLFQFDQLLAPWAREYERRNMENKRIEAVIIDWLEAEEINHADAEQAITSQSGDLWDRATAQARNDYDTETVNPVDFITTISGLSLPVNWAYQYLRGTPENIGPLPITRLLRSATALMGANEGQGINLEAGVRQSLGLPEYDKYEDYRVDRMLSNMAKEGLITAQQAQEAMIDRTGPYYTQAAARVAQMGAIGTFGGGVVGFDLFPEGEAEQRGLKLEYDAALKAKYEGGDEEALNKFWEAHPEYEARRAAMRDPEERLRKFMIAEVWKAYREAPELTQKQMTDKLGSLFTDAFLNTDTRSYDSINTETLTQWARAFGSSVNLETQPDNQQVTALLREGLADPKTAEAYQLYVTQRDQQFPGIYDVQNKLYMLDGKAQEVYRNQHPEYEAYEIWRNAFLAQHPDVIPFAIGESNKVYYARPEVQQYYYQYMAERDQMYPNIMQTQTDYFARPEPARDAYLVDHPELVEYWDWRRETMTQYPDMIPYLMSAESLAGMVANPYGKKEIPTDQLSPEEFKQFDALLISLLYGYYYAGQPLDTAAKKMLRDILKDSGRDMTLPEYIEFIRNNF